MVTSHQHPGWVRFSANIVITDIPLKTRFLNLQGGPKWHSFFGTPKSYRIRETTQYTAITHRFQSYIRLLVKFSPILLLRKLGYMICRIHDITFFCFVTIYAFDRHNDRRTDRRTEFSSLDRVCILRSAVKWYKWFLINKRCEIQRSQVYARVIYHYLKVVVYNEISWRIIFR